MNSHSIKIHNCRLDCRECWIYILDEMEKSHQNEKKDEDYKCDAIDDDGESNPIVLYLGRFWGVRSLNNLVVRVLVIGKRRLS